LLINPGNEEGGFPKFPLSFIVNGKRIRRLEIETNRAKYEIIRELGIIVNSEIKKELEYLIPARRSDEAIKKKLRKKIDDGEITGQLSSVLAIALGITEFCIYRCSYCIYSGEYKDERTHNSAGMDKRTALDTVDFFLKLITHPHRNRENYFDIGFYGGEPLTAFDLVKETIEYAGQKIASKNLSPRFDIGFRLTTNGYLLNDDVIDFLQKKNVKIDISIDGPREEHDKFRLLADGRPTWDTIITNIKKIKEKYPTYFRENVKFLCTIHPLHDFEKIDTFFKENAGLFNNNKIHFSNVALDHLVPHKKDTLKNILGSKRNKHKLDSLFFLQVVRTSIEGKIFLNDVYGQEAFTGVCFPGGEKVYIDSKGRFHICEKMNPHFSIGDIYKGFDYEKIKALKVAYIEEVIRQKCWQCDFWFMCNMCFAYATYNKEIKIKCDSVKKSYKDLIGKYLAKLEKDNEQNLMHSGDPPVDFIDQL